MLKHLSNFGRRAAFGALVCVALAANAGCSAKAGGVVFDPLDPNGTPTGPTTDPTDPTGPNIDAVTTVADRNVVRPGQMVTITCYFVAGGSVFIPEEPVSVTVVPNPGNVQILDNEATFSSTLSGEYRASCGTNDGTLTDFEGTRIVVTNEPPFSWNVDLTDVDCLPENVRVPINHVVYDKFGNALPDINVVATVIPSEGVVGDVINGFRFTEEGLYEMTIEVQEELDPAATIEPVVVSLQVDSTAPTVQITDPAPNSTITGGTYDDETVNVNVVAADTAGVVTTVLINDAPVTVDPAASVNASATQQSRWGLSVATARAEDECGNAAFAAQPFLRSPEFYPAATSVSPAAHVDGSLFAQVSQNFVDDGDRSDIDDLASLAESVISSFDPDESLPAGDALTWNTDPVPNHECFGGPLADLQVRYIARRNSNPSNQFIVEGPWIDEATFLGGGARFGVTLGRFEFPLEIEVWEAEWAGCGWTWKCAAHDTSGCHFSSGPITATVGFSSVTVDGVIGAGVTNGVANASVQSFNFDIEGAFLDLDCPGALDGACDAITSFVIGAAEDFAETAIEDLVSTEVPPMMEEMLSGITINQSVTLPDPINTTLVADVLFDTLGFCGPTTPGLTAPSFCHGGNTNPGSMGFGMSLQMYPTSRGASIPAGTLGAMKGPPAAISFNSTESFGIGLHNDMVNQLFWALWYAGTFDIDLAEFLGESAPEGLSGTMSMGLPPVLMPGRNGNVAELGVGGMRMSMNADLGSLLDGANGEVEMTGSMSMVMGAAIDYDSQEKVLVITVDPNPQFYLNFEEFTGFEDASLVGEALGELIAQEMPTLLNDALLTMPIPEIDVSTIEGVPAGTVWQLQNGGLEYQTGYVQLTGTIGM